MTVQSNEQVPRTHWTPPFLREIEERTEEIGLIDATHELLERDNITVDVEGDFDGLRAHQGGILFVGDHKNQWEFVAAMDLLSRMGRHDMLNIAKFYVQRQIRMAIGHTAAQHVLPVYPRILASDRKGFLTGEALNRFFYRRSLLTAAESEVANAAALTAASDSLTEGGVVNIYPSGSVVDATQRPWRAGVGRIIQQIPQEAREDVLITPYRIKDISRARLVGAVMMRGKGFLGRPQNMTVQLAPMQTAAELVDGLPEATRDDPATITARLREQFLDFFQPAEAELRVQDNSGDDT